MLQELIVYIIISVAVGWLFFGIYRRMKEGKQNKTCASCTGCPLKDNCMKNKPVPEKPVKAEK